MNIRNTILTASIAFSLVSPSVNQAAGPMAPMGGGAPMGGSPPAGGQQYPVPQQQYPVPQAQPSPRGPSEGEIWEQLDETMRNVQRRREQEAEIERSERGADVERSIDRPLSRGERQADVEHFTRKGRSEARRLSSSVKSKKALEQRMLRLLQKDPSNKGLRNEIKKNREQINREENELRRTRDFLERNR